MQNLTVFRSKLKGLPDLLNYAALVDSGIVKGKDGSLLAGFWYQGKDSASATSSDLNLATQRVNDALRPLGSGWASWIEAVRFKSPGYPERDRSHFPDPVTRMIDEERRATFSGGVDFFESEYALVLQYMPPMQRKRSKKSKIKPLGEMVFDDDSAEESSPEERIIESFKKTITDIEDKLSAALDIRRMESKWFTDDHGVEHMQDELVNFLAFAIRGEAASVDVPPIPMYMDSYIAGQELWPGTTPRLGDKFICTIGIEGFPSASYPGLLEILDSLPLSYRWSTRFIHLDALDAERALSRYHKKWQQKIRGLWSQVFKTAGGMINTDALAMTMQAEAAINEVRSGLVSYGYYTPVIVLMHEKREWLQEQARFVKKSIEKQGFAARVETINTMESWLGTLPGHANPNVRRPAINTLNLADLLPLSRVWPGLPVNPCPFYAPGSPPLLQAATTGATPFRLNLHVGDLGHTLIFGPTGAGKSTLLSTIAAQFRRYRNNVGGATVMAFDKGESMLPLALACGRHYSIGDASDASDSPAYCPLSALDTPSDVAWAEEWIATCYELTAGKSLTPEQRGYVHDAMLRLRESPTRSLTEFNAEVQDEEVRAALQYYTVSGTMGYLLDAAEDGLKDEAFAVFEIDDLLKLGDKASIPVLLYLFRRFEKSLKGQPALLVVDEAWVVLGHPVFRPKLREWLKEMRKKNCAIVLATQSLSDAASSGILDVLIEACPTKILLPNSEADKRGTEANPGPRDLYAQFGLNARQVQILKSALPKRQYYYTSPYGNRLFELALGPVALAFVGASDKESQGRIRTLAKEYGRDWPKHWLKERGINDEVYERAA